MRITMLFFEDNYFLEGGGVCLKGNDICQRKVFLGRPKKRQIRRITERNLETMDFQPFFLLKLER